jgi:hypothetical protein
LQNCRPCGAEHFAIIFLSRAAGSVEVHEFQYISDAYLFAVDRLRLPWSVEVAHCHGQHHGVDGDDLVVDPNVDAFARCCSGVRAMRSSGARTSPPTR